MLIIEDLYNGNINPLEKCVREGSEHQKINKRLSECFSKLNSLLNSDEKKLLEEIEDKFLKLNCISERECFVDGFRIGAQIILDIIQGKSENFF